MKKSNFSSQYIYYIIFLMFIVMIIQIILGTIISYNTKYYSIKLLRITSIFAVFLSFGLLINFIISRHLIDKFTFPIIILISTFIISGIYLSGLILIFFLEPLFMLYELPIIVYYFFVNYLFIILLSFILSGILKYHHMTLNRERKLNQEIILRKEIEKKLYLSKVNPHFLFNSLNLILSLLHKPKTAEDCLIRLSELLRFNLDASQKEQISLIEELKYVQFYLEIQKLRFDQRLDFKIKCEYDIMIPPLILQPLVENCIKHNINKTSYLLITINVAREKNSFFIHVSDTMKEIKPDMIGKGLGLINTQKRVELAGGQFKINEGEIVLVFQL